MLYNFFYKRQCNLSMCVFPDNKTERRKNIVKKSDKLSCSPALSDSSISVGDDSNCSGELFKNKSSVYSYAYVQPTETLSDFLLEDDEPNGM